MKRQRQTPQPSSDIAQLWLQSRRCVSVEGIDLLPQENILFKGHPLVIARGQAQAFYLHDAVKRVWILKKFLPGRNPNAQYIKAIQALIPPHPGFESGSQRKVLSRASVAASRLPAADFPDWLESTILMPLVKGSDWAYIADKVRDGRISLTPEQRLLLCRNLSEKVSLLEHSNLSHRDLSSTNIFIDTNTWDVHLIDWDSIYHPSLTIPPNTTFGTNGYIAPFVKVNGREDSHITWTPGADRFSMAVLNIEFLSVERNSPLTGDGGLLNQDEIYNLGGSGLNAISGGLQRNFQHALGLFDRILRAKNFDECPCPDEWKALGAGVTAPSLKEIYDPQPDFLLFIQKLQQAKTPTPAPLLRDIEAPDFSSPPDPSTVEPAPQSPRLADLEPFDWPHLPPFAPLETAQPAPRLTELHEPAEGDVSPVAPAAAAPAPPAPSLTDVEDPLIGAQEERRE